MSAQLNMYLAEARSKLDAAGGCRAVIGSEAADLDSMASAIMYGYFDAVHEPRKGWASVPVINIPRRDFVLRTEAVYLFGALAIDVAALLFIDEIDLGALHRDSRLRLTLVDHNTLATGQAEFADAVEAILDHHQDAGLYREADPRTIEPVGSATTLVADAILRGHPALLDAQTATLLLGTILLDTVNLSPEAGRVTAKDKDVAARLSAIAGGDPAALFKKLQFEKFNIANLGTPELLRKDYKEGEAGGVKFGISSVLTSLQTWIGKDAALIDACDAFRRSQGLDALLAMLAFTDADGRFRRELAVFTGDEESTRRLAAFLQASASGFHRLQPAGLAASDRAAFFSQDDASLSRKKLQPLIKQLFSAED